MKKFIAGLLLCICLSLYPVRFLLSANSFPIHDDTQIGRVMVMGDALADFHFPVRWVSELGLGYGYPIYNFYGPLPYYAGGLMSAIKIPPVIAANIMMILGFVGVAVSGFILGYAVFGIAGGVALSVLFAYAPYHAVQLYVRGAIGELWAYAFVPLVFLGIFFIIRHRPRRAVLAFTAGISGMIVSHTVYGYIVVGCAAVSIFLLGLLSIIRRNRITYLIPLITGTVYSLFLTAFFWLPALVEKRHTSVEGFFWDTVNFRDHFVCPIQFWSSHWGFGGSAAGCLNDGMSFMLGKLHIILFVAGMILIARYFRRLYQDSRNFLMIMLLTGFFAVFMMLPASEFFWQIIPQHEYVQYPWRFLMVAVLGVSVVGVGGIYAIRHTGVKYMSLAVLIILTILYNSKWFMPQYLTTHLKADIESPRYLQWEVSKISDEYLFPDIRRPSDDSFVPRQPFAVSGPAKVKILTDTATRLALDVEATQASVLTINRAYFPGWKYYLDSRSIKPDIRDGLPEIPINSGRHHINALFTNTPVRILANIFSMIGIAFIVIYGKKTQH